jgi:2-keto-3-deoxy-L-rhamnonate aldolase RhmA
MFYERNKILTMVEQKKIPLGIQCFTGNTELVEVMGATGFDFVMFDCVHSGNDVRAMEELVSALHGNRPSETLRSRSQPILCGMSARPWKPGSAR